MLVTILGLALFAFVGVGIRLVMMLTFQQRRERMNRQINERLRTLIAAYKVLGGSFTGNLTVDPRHLRDLRRQAASGLDDDDAELFPGPAEGSERRRRIRDAVEAALSDIILLGTEEQVRLAQRAVIELVAGRPVHTHDLVISLRNFIREALDLDPIPTDIVLPPQGPARPAPAGGRGKGEGDKGDGGRGQGGARSGGGGGGSGVGMGAGMGAGMGGGVGVGAGVGLGLEDEADEAADGLPGNR